VQEGSVADHKDDTNRLMPGDVIVSVVWPSGRYRVGSKADFETVMRHFGERPPREIQLLVATKEGYFRVLLEIKGERS
jgi:hypothetical protein